MENRAAGAWAGEDLSVFFLSNRATRGAPRPHLLPASPSRLSSPDEVAEAAAIQAAAFYEAAPLSLLDGLLFYAFQGEVLGALQAKMKYSVADGFAAAASFAVSVLDAMGARVDLDDRAALVRVAATSLSSKVVSQHSALLAPMAVDAVMAVRDPARPDSVDLRDVRVGESGGGERKSGEREEKRGRARARAPTPPFPPSAPQSPNSAAPSTTRSSLTASSSTSRPPSPPAARRAWRTPRSA